MICDVQVASVWKRMSAWLLDIIVFLILATGFAYLTSVVTNYGSHDEKLHDYYSKYEEEYNARIDITSEEYEALTEEEQQRYKDMFEALNNDQNVLYEYNMVINLMMVIASVGCLFAVLIGDFIIPLFLKNGQTVGKKVFGIGLVKINSVRISNIQLFARTILGKYAIELMIPVIMIILLLSKQGGMFSIILIVAIALFQLGLCIFTKYHQAIHDVLAYTVVVDLHTQMIFKNEDELLNYKKENHLLESQKSNS